MCVQLTGNSQVCHGTRRGKFTSSNDTLMTKKHPTDLYPCFWVFCLKNPKTQERQGQKFCITNGGDVTESLSSAQEGELNDMEGIIFSFTTAACRRSFNMHRKCPRGELSQSSQAAVSSHHLSVLPSPGKPLQSQSKRLEGGYNDTGEGTTVCIESK